MKKTPAAAPVNLGVTGARVGSAQRQRAAGSTASSGMGGAKKAPTTKK